MRPDHGNPLDLNNLPDDYSSRDYGKQQLLLDDAVSTGYRKKKSGGKEECGKVYECRFCSLKFCKSQALGGHMNRHRQERETETLNRARQLVFSNDNLAAQAHLSCCHPITPPPGSGYHHPPPPQPAGPDPIMPLRFPARMFSGNSSSAGFIPPPPPPPQQQHHQPYMYASPVRPPPQPLSFSPHYQPPTEHYYVGHVLGGTNNTSALTSSSSLHPHNNKNYAPATEPNYTCIGAPVGPTHVFGRGTTAADSGGRDGSLH